MGEHDRERLEQLCRYLLRPPLATTSNHLALRVPTRSAQPRPAHVASHSAPDRARCFDRLRALDDGRIAIELKRPWADRTTHVTMTADAFIARLASLVPRPRKNTTVYFGMLAAHAKGRGDIVPCPAAERRTRPDASWAALMKRSFGFDVLKCPRCDGWLQLVAVLRDREEVRRLLEHLHLWSEPKPLHPARGPPDPQ